MLQKNFSRAQGASSFALLNLLLLLSLPMVATAQLKDNLYLIDETAVREVDIFQVDSKKVKFRNKEGKDLAYHTKHVLLAFNGQGKYLTFPNSAEEVKHFFAREEEQSKHDLIVTLSQQVISGHIQKEDEFEIEYHDLTTDAKGKKLSSTEIVAILYKDGKHKLFTSPSQASHILTALREDISSSRQEKSRNQGIQPMVLLASNEETKEEIVEEEVLIPVAEEKQAATLEIDYEVYKQKALQKTADLGTYLGIISDKNSDLMKADKAIELALRLFVNENAQVEVSSKSSKNRYKIRNYLNRLKLLKYDKIEISWSDISYVSDLKKGADGNYYGIITIQQRFNGFMDGQLVYTDLTEKNVEVVVKAYEKETNGEKQEMWGVFLSNIGVVVTNFD